MSLALFVNSVLPEKQQTQTLHQLVKSSDLYCLAKMGLNDTMNPIFDF